MKARLSADELSGLSAAIAHLGASPLSVLAASVEVDGEEFRIERDPHTNELVMEIKQ